MRTFAIVSTIGTGKVPDAMYGIELVKQLALNFYYP
jgi:hypothetical protein